MIQHVRVAGTARRRGQMYGEQARPQVERSIEAYGRIFEHYAGWDWSTVVQHARRFVDPIGDFDARYLEEMRGIAEGAGVPFEDVLAINVRTEVMFAAKARSATARLSRTAECTSFAVVPPPGSSRGVLVGQNWDWALHAVGTVVVVEAEQDDGPAYVTVVEAGLLAKTGFNSHGLGVVTNALVSDADLGEPGVPYHVMLRGLLDASSPSAALSTLQRAPRSSSANYLLAHRSGLALDVEGAPGDFSRLYLTPPDERGHLVHGNHFEHPGFTGADVGLWLMPDSPFRMQRARGIMRQSGFDATPSSLFGMLGDHAGEPAALCCHPDPSEHPLERSTTVVSVVMDLADSSMWLVHGSPCTTAPRHLQYGQLLTAA
jgi:isopenicillin-N N-acyltransferase like protein